MYAKGAVKIISNHVAVVGYIVYVRTSTYRVIDCREFAIAITKTVDSAVVFDVTPDDIARRANTRWFGPRDGPVPSLWVVNRREDSIAPEKAVLY